MCYVGFNDHSKRQSLSFFTQTLFVKNVLLGSQKVELSIFTECSPLRVHNHMPWIIMISIPVFEIVNVLKARIFVVYWSLLDILNHELRRSKAYFV